MVPAGDYDGLDADFGAEVRDGGGDCCLLGAGGQAVAGVFDVAAGDDFTTVEQDGCADVEVAVGRVGMVRGGFGPVGERGELSGVDHVC